MFNNKYSNVLTIILVIVIIIILGLLAFLAYDIYQKYYIDKDAGNYVDQFEEQVKNKVDTNTTSPTNNQIGDVESPLNSLNTVNPSGDANGNSGKTQQYKGFDVLGTISIPKTKVDYPILADMSTSALEVAVAYYYGPGLNQVGNTTIVGHNYRNGLFFSNNKKLSNGDKIYITDATGTKIGYTIYNMYETTQQDAEYLTRNTNGAREISLSTCTDDSSMRLVIWAKEG